MKICKFSISYTICWNERHINKYYSLDLLIGDMENFFTLVESLLYVYIEWLAVCRQSTITVSYPRRAYHVFTTKEDSHYWTPNLMPRLIDRLSRLCKCFTWIQSISYLMQAINPGTSHPASTKATMTAYKYTTYSTSGSQVLHIVLTFSDHYVKGIYFFLSFKSKRW